MKKTFRMTVPANQPVSKKLRLALTAAIAGVLASLLGWQTASFEEARAEEKSPAIEKNDDEIIGGERVALRAPAAASSRNTQSRKRYPGGMDEDDLQVQDTLPIPSRTLDGIVNSTGGEAAESAPAAND